MLSVVKCLAPIRRCSQISHNCSCQDPFEAKILGSFSIKELQRAGGGWGGHPSPILMPYLRYYWCAPVVLADALLWAWPVHFLSALGCGGLVVLAGLVTGGGLAGLHGSWWAWREIQCTGGGLLTDTGPTHQHLLEVNIIAFCWLL